VETQETIRQQARASTRLTRRVIYDKIAPSYVRC
jgi:hypothetical protein